MPSKCERIRSCYNFGRKYIYENFNVSVKYNYICNHAAINLRLESGRIAFLLIFSISLGVGVPLYKTFLADEKELLIPAIMPFINPNKQFGFYINTIDQLAVCTFGFFIILGVEVSFCVVKDNITVAAAIIENELMELKHDLEDEKKLAYNHIRKFRNIILQTLDLNRFESVNKNNSHFTQFHYIDSIIEFILSDKSNLHIFLLMISYFILFYNRFVAECNETMYWKFFLGPALSVYSVSMSILSYLKVIC